VNLPNAQGVGLFAGTRGADIRNLQIVGGAMTGGGYVGALAGYAYNTTVTNVQASTAVTAISNSGGSVYAGGLIGEQDHYLASTAVNGSSASGAVYATGGAVYAGGLEGYFNGNYYGTVGGITASSASGTVSVGGYQGSSTFAGGLIGYFSGIGGVSNSSASGAVNANSNSNSYYSSYLGGLIGSEAYGGISGSTASGNVTDSNGTTYSSYAGGLVGYFGGTGISNSSASGAVSNNYIAGGLVGYYSGSSALNNVSASGNVSSQYYAGGLVGGLTAGITTGFASGNVTASGSSGYAGGLVGYGYSSSTTGISDSSASGSVTGNTAGGLAGYYYAYYTGSALIANSHASGAVSGSNAAGGLVGNLSDYSGSSASGNAVGSSYATGSVSLTGGYYAGGLIGIFQGYRPISDSYATGNVTANNGSNPGYIYAGGLVGYFNNSSSSATNAIVRSFASGSVTVAQQSSYYYDSPSYVGGLVGYFYGSYGNSAASIVDSYATGNVSASGANYSVDLGGLVGYLQYVSISNTYSTGAVASSVTGSSYYASALGGLVGAVGSSVTTTNSYWSTDASGLSTSAAGTGLTSSQMTQAASFSGWNIASTANAGTTWRIYQGETLPLLSGFLTPVTLNLADASKVYDGTTSLAGVSLSSPGGAVLHPETIYAAVSSSDVGSYSLSAANLYSSQLGYDLTVSGSGTLSVTQRPLTLTGVVADKVYDGTTNATLTATGAPSGLVAGQSLTVNTANVTALFSDKNVGNNKTVTVSGYTLADGVNGKASNYSLANSTSTTASITPAPLVAGSFSATDRTYDGTTTVAVTATPASTLTGVFGSDSVSVSLAGVSSGTMADKNVGTAKPVTVTGASLTGADAGNYYIAGIANVTVNITPATLTANGISATNRNYNDGTYINLSASSASLSGVVAGDTVDFSRNSLTGNTADANAANGKAVTVTGLTLIGPDAANYSLVAGSVSVNITPLPITVYAYQNALTNKVYDGSTAANISLSYINYDGSNLVVSDTSATYSDKNVGTNKTITVSGFSLSGSAAGNYSLANSSSTTYGSITPKSLSVSGVTAVNRVYDGTTNVTVNVANASVDSSGVVSGDNVSISAPGSGSVVGSIATKNVGNALPVTVPGLTLTGTDAGNYTLSGSNGVTVNITPKPLTATYVGIDKVYDGTTYAQVTASSTDIVSGDSVQFASNYYSQNGYYSGYAIYTGTGAKNVGSNKPISITYDYLYGTDANNYSFVNAGQGTATASITPKPITAAFTGVNKVYDGGTAATVSLNTSASGIVSGDAISATDTAVFASKNVTSGGTAINVSNIALGGADAGNYTLSATTATTSANITPLAVTISGITATNRAYDGTVNVALTAGTVTSSGFISGDNVSVSLPAGGISTGTMADKNVGNAKPVTVTGLSLAGSDAADYAILGTSTTVNITPMALTASYTGVDRVYNGGISATVVASTSGIVSGDNLGFTQTAVFSGSGGKNVGTSKPISVTNIALTGSDDGNYSLTNTTASTTASITPKPVTVSYTASNRVYDGTADTSASVSGSSAQLIAGDVVSFSQSAAFAGDGSAGVGKTVNVSNIALAGTDAANYSLTATTAATTATITPKPIGVTGITTTNRVYDGTNVVAVNVADASIDTTAIVSGDQVSVTLPSNGITTGTTADRNVGTAKPVTVSGLGITGASAADYTLLGATGLVVNITPLSVSASYSASDKVYDGTVSATVSGSSTGFLSVDSGTVGVVASGSFSGTGAKDVGSGKTVTVSNAYLSGAGSGNYLLANPTGTTTASISPLAITPSYVGGSKVYDGGSSAPVNAATSGIVAGDQVSFGQTAVFTGSNAKDVGSGKAIAISGITLSGADAMDYSLTATTATASGSVTPKPITIDGLSGVTATSRVYDGTTTVAVNVPSNVTLTPNSSDIVSGDNVTISLPTAGITTGTLATKGVGTNKAVVVSGLSLSGTDAADYLIAGTQGITVNITPVSLTAVYTGVNKVYDGTAAASVVGSSGSILAGDSVSISGSGVFTGSGAKNVGTGKAISVTGASLSGADAVDYSLLNPTGSATADITPLAITASYSGGSKVYDGSTTAPVIGSAGFIANDNVSLSQVAVFTGSNAKDVGSGKTVAVSSIALSGADAANYTLTSTTASTSASVTPKPLTIDGLTGVSATNRVYDGSTQVAVTVTSSGPLTADPADIVAGDVVTVNAPAAGTTTGTLADKNVGTNKPVTVTGLTLGGADAADYSIAATAGVTVNITPLALTAVYTGVNKVYDGTAAASVTGSSVGIVSGDNVIISGTGLFTGNGAKNVGTAKSISVQNGSLGGSDAVDYSLANPGGTASADITPLTVTASYTGGTKVYDGSTAAPVTGSVSGFISGDSVSLSQTAVFTGNGAKDVGSNKTVNVSAIALQGLDAGNYALAGNTATTTASVTPKPLTIDGLTGVTATNRVYNGSNLVAVTLTSSGPLTPDPADIVAGDVVTVNAPAAGSTTGTLADKNVGTNKPVTVTGLTLGGADAADYMVAATTGVTVNISPLAITAVYTGVNKVYDGTAAASVLGSASGILAGDAVAISGSGVFLASAGVGAKDVANGKTISVSGASLSGADAIDYSLLNPSGTASANITPLAISVSYLGGSKVYDGSSNAPVTASASGVIAGDNLGFSQTAVFTGANAKDVGSGKAVQVSAITLTGTDAIDYSLLNTTASTSASVTPRPLNVTGLTGLSAVDRVYDGTTAVQVVASGPLSAGTGNVIAGDQVTVNLPAGGVSAGTLADKNVGVAKPVVVSGLTLSGADAADYQITGTAGVTVTISPRPVVLLGLSAVNRVYDGTTQVAISTSGGSISGAIAGDNLSLLTSGVTGSMADKNVGNDKPVTVTGVALGGSDAGNYVVSSGTALAVNITPYTLVASVSAANKVYDGNTAATVSLGDNRVAGDSLSLADTSASFADANAGSGKAVTVTGLSLSGADAGNYQLASTSLGTVASITPAPLTVSANSLSKVYGDTLGFDGSGFTATGLVASQTIGQVTLSSAGAAAPAAVGGSPYAINVSNAGGGSFNPGNYSISYESGQLQVTPRPLTVAGNSLVRASDAPNPASFGYSTNPGGLVNGDSLASVTVAVPAGSADAPGGSVFAITPSAAVFGSGSAANYSLNYVSGLLVVVPTPPVVGQSDSGSSGAQNFAIQLDPAQLAQAQATLDSTAAAVAQPTPGQNTQAPKARDAVLQPGGTANPAELAVLLAADSASINLAGLRKLPLFSIDPQLQTLLAGRASAAPDGAAPAAKPAPAQ
jgi:hypothetical protein